jgi:hypothetical protein
MAIDRIVPLDDDVLLPTPLASIEDGGDGACDPVAVAEGRADVDGFGRVVCVGVGVGVGVALRVGRSATTMTVAVQPWTVQ